MGRGASIPLVVRSGPVPATAAAALSTPHGPVTSLYIHIPFCVHKCHYCDFYSIVDEHDRQEAFLQRLTDELRHLAPHAAGAPLKTIFIGGGTPSLMRVPLWRTLLGVLASLFDMSRIRARDADADTEFTVECNPESVTLELVEALLAGGVDRLSMGAQSFNPAHLKTLERWHDPASVGRALAIARRAGVPRLSLDLIFAIPGQTLEEWQADLRTATDLDTGHLSCYSLTYEPNTAMTKRLERGEFAAAPEDLEAAMYEDTVGTLSAAGLARYEVSNFARAGKASQHNLVYWRNEPWLAAGPGASGHVAGWRWKNAPNLREYLASAGGLAPAIDIEGPDPARALRERIMMGIRLAEGLDASVILTEAGAISPRAAAALEAAAARATSDGLLEPQGLRWRLTGRGFLCADRVAAGLMGAIPKV